MRRRRVQCRAAVSAARIAAPAPLTLEEALWAGDVDRLQELAGCICCCGDHTFEWCPARAWYGCRGQGSTPEADREAWVAHYERFHGMTREQFFA